MLSHQTNTGQGVMAAKNAAVLYQGNEWNIQREGIMDAGDDRENICNSLKKSKQ